MSVFKIRSSSITASKLSLDPQILNNTSTLNKELTEIKAEVIKSLIFTEDCLEYIFPASVQKLFITIISGGGAGGCGQVLNGVYYSGGGGGAGAVINKIKILNSCPYSGADKKFKIKVKVGKGGVHHESHNPELSKGGDTAVLLFLNDDLIEEYSSKGALGGGCGINNQGGKGFPNYYFLRESNGKDGEVMMSCQGLPKGGDGGPSIYDKGGVGMKKISEQSIQSINGQSGSGGGGIPPGIDLKYIGKGGSGMVLVDYV